jgi:hypothetical protein
MHSESFSARCGLPVAIEKPEWGALPAPLEGEPPLSAGPPLPSPSLADEEACVREVVVVVTLAMPGLLALPPQPAARMLTTTASVTAPNAREAAAGRRGSVTAGVARIVAGSLRRGSFLGGKE